MDRLVCTVLLCVLAIYAVTGMPRTQQEKIIDDVKGLECRDMSTDCVKFRNKTYLCEENKYSESYCMATCGFCTPSDVIPDIDVGPCEISFSDHNATFPVGFHFTLNCASCHCEVDRYECTDIYCGEAFTLPDKDCEWQPSENPDHCCLVPVCPDGIEIEYPPFWVEH